MHFQQVSVNWSGMLCGMPRRNCGLFQLLAPRLVQWRGLERDEENLMPSYVNLRMHSGWRRMGHGCNNCI
ncbi:hypothetical protein KC19_VG053000 [Ceratodon purpureus]|uniref:Uncharacterized protein n=1 Tax=Ceratodon purpureus TaxID=3225 RepID=A0A8T0HM91_CERPU|nr:hypothetical protein KC19_VG053000 [Ceratodon purpureus]